MGHSTSHSPARHHAHVDLVLVACGAVAIPALTYLVLTAHRRTFRGSVGETALSWGLDFLAIFLVVLAAVGLLAAISGLLATYADSRSRAPSTTAQSQKSPPDPSIRSSAASSESEHRARSIRS